MHPARTIVRRAALAAALATTLAATLPGCATTGQQPAAATPSLAQAYQGRFLIGAAVEPSQLDTPEGRLLAAQFNSVVAENAMKPSRIQPRENEFDFAPADAIVDFARQHGMAVRGHTLLWYKRTPDWFWTGQDGKPASRELVLSRLKRHIETVMGRYRTSVHVWDVVNEVIDAGEPDCLRQGPWLQVVGPDYIDWAFRYAHAVDPEARLIINDYSTTQPAKRECLRRVVQGLLDRGVPVHGVGHQMHISIFEPSAAEVDETLSMFARLGLENQITEMDLSLYRRHAYLLSEPSERLLALQGQRYESLMRVFLVHPELTSVTWWGISDFHTARNSGWDWWRSDQPLLFDHRQGPKPAYWGALKAAGQAR